jgi:translation initiation factor 3 subunit A
MKLAQLEREKNDINERLRVTGKRIDHLERAFRKEEIKKLPADHAAQRERDLAAYDKTKAQVLKDAEAKHSEDLEISHRLSRLMPLYSDFVESVKGRRHDEFERRRRDAEKELEKQIAIRKKEYRDRKLREKREREERERLMREEEERIAREAEEKAAREEKKRLELQELKAIRDKERQEALEMSALQERRAAEALARRDAQKAAASIPTRVPPEHSDSSDRRPPLQFAGAKPFWREKEALRPTVPEVSPAARTLSPMRRPDSNDRVSGLSGQTRPLERADSNERLSGPPRLALTGNKPSWREREAAKLAAVGEPTDSTPPAGTSALRPSAGGAPLSRGRSGRSETERESSASQSAPTEALKPSGAPGKWVPSRLRDRA